MAVPVLQFCVCVLYLSAGVQGGATRRGAGGGVENRAKSGLEDFRCDDQNNASELLNDSVRTEFGP